MPKKYLYAKLKEDYAGHKEGEIIKILGKVPPHLKRYVTEVKESTYNEYQEALRSGKIQGNVQAQADVNSGIDSQVSPYNPDNQVDDEANDGDEVSAREVNEPNEQATGSTAKVMGVDTNNPTKVTGEGEIQSNAPGARASEKVTTKTAAKNVGKRTK